LYPARVVGVWANPVIARLAADIDQRITHPVALKIF
jgi:hypothetical protein